MATSWLSDPSNHLYDIKLHIFNRIEWPITLPLQFISSGQYNIVSQNISSNTKSPSFHDANLHKSNEIPNNKSHQIK